mmetsp:Transcript_44900/g.66036  ORF Transcript_44900/g.66036 Transcript_44900/m.66036 type:complete len:230 (+) Transcript_44900:145-834(+)
MRVSFFSTAFALVNASLSSAFTPSFSASRTQCAFTRNFMSSSTMAESGVPPSSSSTTDVEDMDMPTKLPSDVGMDYIPLATLLATGQLAEADQFTRDALVVLAGSKEKGRDFVYFTEVKNIPSTDLATIERLWSRFSGGKFGFSVQKKKYRQSKQDFELFCRKIGWTAKDGDMERKKRWFGASEFIYDVKKAPEGHLPLTSALRGTSLLKQLLAHPVWDNDDWKKEPEN